MSFPPYPFFKGFAAGGGIKVLGFHCLSPDRKCTTRAFAPGMADVPERYKTTGQPIVGGSMETGSYLLVSVPSGDQTFYSTVHGSGRAISRTKARKTYRGEKPQ